MVAIGVTSSQSPYGVHQQDPCYADILEGVQRGWLQGLAGPLEAPLYTDLKGFGASHFFQATSSGAFRKHPIAF